MRANIFVCVLCAMFCACQSHEIELRPCDDVSIELKDVARMLSELPLGDEHFNEVFEAVKSSSEHGYDEEYTMTDLFESPGRGVGASDAETKAQGYGNPLRDLISEYLNSNTKAGGNPDGIVLSPEAYMDSLSESDIQIYWPYSESWDGESLPVITFDPGTGMTTNVGYELSPEGVRTLVVDEEMAKERPVWVVNRNDDAEFKTIEMMRREDPEWAQGGSVVINPHKHPDTKAGDCQSLVLHDFKMKRHFDSWFAGASEFFIKVGAIENFNASTEAELKLYVPEITDFVIVVRRSQLGLTIPFNAILISEWTDQLSSFAFMIVEDDGGTRTSWDTTAVVKVNSKSYGVELKLPFRTADDIVWRGQLSKKYFLQDDIVKGHFGDVELSFSFE